MNVRVSIVLILLLTLVGSYVFLFELRKPEVTDPIPPWFYDVEMAEILRIVITHEGEAQSFVQAPDQTWHFDTPEGTPVDMFRFSGVALLLSGPRSQQTVFMEGLDPAEYGLESPETMVSIGLTGGRSITMELGDLTPDGDGQYVRLRDPPSPTIFTVSNTWGGVLTRLVTDPPYPPTPEEETPSTS